MYHVEVTNLETSVVMAGSCESMQINFLITGNMPAKFSDASQHFLSKTGVLGAFFMWESINTATDALVKSWVTERYAAEDTGEVVTSTRSSNFVIEIDV